ncbi:MAG TPA: alpha/beta hydrolase [Verrucomicrobiae bacterium]|jgi:pimeloyl-ACP methyl ester carboxylesterase
MTEVLQIRVHGTPTLPTLIYLPGLHGDWTLIGDLRKYLAGQVCLVELTYPRTLEWSLDDYAANIETLLAQNGITEGWLLGESYGSQVLWPLVGRGNFKARGMILAGGFVRHPLRWLLQGLGKNFNRLPFFILVWSMYAFTKYSRKCLRRANETAADVDEFAVRRTKLDAQAATHRLYLVSQSDFRPIARATRLPVFYLSGLIDPIVPWPWVQHWLKRNCPALRGCKIIFTADHNVLGTASAKAARQIVAWMNQ